MSCRSTASARIETLRDALSHVVAQLQAAATVKPATRIHSLLDIAGDANLLGRVEDLTRRSPGSNSC